jgi:hypothetical protein
MTPETRTLHAIMLEISKAHAIVFRNNVAMAWVGQIVTRSNGMVTIDNARPLHAGLCEGSSDLIGWKSTTITSEMVGRKVAVFVAIEVKAGKGRATQAQLNFIQNVRNAGGIAGLARSPDEARNLIENHNI